MSDQLFKNANMKTKKAALRRELLWFIDLCLSLFDSSSFSVGYLILFAVKGDFAVFAEVHFAVFHVPFTIFVAVNTVGVEVNFTFLDTPPAIIIFGNAGVAEIDKAVGHFPPAIFVLRNSGVSRVK